MSFDYLQSLIKTTKCPLAVELSPAVDEGAEDFLAFSLSLMDSLRGVAPAVRLSLNGFLRLGWRGMKLLEELLAQAKAKGLFTILDLSFCDMPSPPTSPLPADCLVLSGYLGSDAVNSYLPLCQDEDKCLFLLAHTANPSAGELQDLVAGDRLVYQVVGDLAQRLGKDNLGRLGYSNIGIGLEGVWPSDLRNLRKRWEQSFLLVSGDASDVRFAFDKYGRGAIVSTAAPLQAARNKGGDPAAALECISALRDELKQFITFL